MKIARPEPVSAHALRAPRRPGVTGALIVALIAFALGASVQALAARPLSDAARLARNPAFAAASAAERSRLPVVYLDLEFKDVQRLRSTQTSAQAVGVHLPTANEVVSGSVRLNDHPVPVHIRVLPGPAEPAGRWALEVTPTQGQLLGQPRLMLYHASTHRALAQWGLAESLQREGIAAAPMQAVQAVLDGDPLGVYGAWADPPAPQAGERVWFDMSIAWQDLRRAPQGGPALTTIDLADCQVAGLATSAPAHSKAQALLQDVQKGRRAASEVIDAGKLGTMLALAALWQGSPQIDWAQLQFAVAPEFGDDPAQARLQPVAGPNLISAASGDLRWPACFDDPVLQAAFVRAAERVSRPEYLDGLKAGLGQRFAAMQQALPTQDDQPELTWDDLAAHQRMMARWLEPTQMVLATWTLPPAGPLKANTAIPLSLANLQKLPVEVLGLETGKGNLLPFDPAWIAPGSSLTATVSGTLVLPAGQDRLRWVDLRLPYSQVMSEPAQIQVVARLVGLARQQSIPARQESTQP